MNNHLKLVKHELAVLALGNNLLNESAVSLCLLTGESMAGSFKDHHLALQLLLQMVGSRGANKVVDGACDDQNRDT